MTALPPTSSAPRSTKETPGPGTGLLYDLGAHLIDQALQLFGDPEAIFADLFIIRDNSKVDDYMEVLLYYPGLRVRLKSSYLVREPLPAYSIFGHQGTFIKTRGDVQEKHLLAGEPPIGDNWGVEPESEQGLLHTEIDGKLIRERAHYTRKKDLYMDYFTGMYEAIRNDAPSARHSGTGRTHHPRHRKGLPQSRAEKGWCSVPT